MTKIKNRLVEASTSVKKITNTQHGFYSKEFVLTVESQEEYTGFMADMMSALAPVGAFEKQLVEKIVNNLWRQKRFERAELARIAIQQSLDHLPTRFEVNDLLRGNGIYNGFDADDLNDLNDSDRALIDKCQGILTQADAIDPFWIDTADTPAIMEHAPSVFEALKLDEVEGDIRPLFDELVDRCNATINKYKNRPLIQSLFLLVRSGKSDLIDCENLNRRYITLNNELHKLAESLRKQQEHRLKLENPKP